VSGRFLKGRHCHQPALLESSSMAHDTVRMTRPSAGFMPRGRRHASDRQEQAPARQRRLSDLRNQKLVGANCHHEGNGKTRDIVAHHEEDILLLTAQVGVDPASFGHLKAPGRG
jgi:hypothetical protein